MTKPVRRQNRNSQRSQQVRDTQSPRLVREFAEDVTAPNGRHYTVRAYTAQRTDGTWIGWLAFTDPTGETRSTAFETTQPNLKSVMYWAGGLEPVYLEGAFVRATTVLTPAVGDAVPEHRGEA